MSACSWRPSLRKAFRGQSIFEIGAATWGRSAKGGALGADGNIVKIKHSYLDWVVPGTAVKTRMGIQRIFLPDYASEASQVFDADVAGINVSAPSRRPCRRDGVLGTAVQ